METGSFNAPQVVRHQGILSKSVDIPDQNFIVLLLKVPGENTLVEVMASKGAPGLKGLRKGANVLLTCQRTIAGFTNYINKLEAIGTHSESADRLIRATNLDSDEDEFDFVGLSVAATASAEPTTDN